MTIPHTGTFDRTKTGGISQTADHTQDQDHAADIQAKAVSPLCRSVISSWRTVTRRSMLHQLWMCLSLTTK